MGIELLNESGFTCNEDSLRSVTTFAIKEMGLHPDCDVEISLVDEDAISALHVQWMDLEGPTDVLSFPMDELTPHSAAKGPGIIGDIVLCPQFAAKQAKNGVEAELQLLTIHGLLHCIGFDHADEKDEKVMFALQEKILRDWQGQA